MNLTWSECSRIPGEELQQRLNPVKELSRTDLELYEISQDTETKEHYLHFSYIHRNLAAGGAVEEFHQLLPLESDDVLGMLFGEQAYAYPRHWNKPFLRNGPDGDYVWFDPSGIKEEELNEQLGRNLNEILVQFKREGTIDEESVTGLLGRLDKLMDDGWEKK